MKELKFLNKPINLYEKTIIKKAAEMQQGDVIEYEFGDFGNKRKSIFDSCKTDAFTGVCTEIIVIDINTGEKSCIYDTDNIDTVTFEVIGAVEQ